MSLAVLANIPDPRDENTFHEFSFSNQNSHTRIVTAIGVQKKISLSIYVLDPMPWFDIGVWLANHQQMHDDMNGVSGVSGVDLTSVDWTNEEQAVNWIRLHWSEHQQNEQILGISQ
jgi:hypothetical protein